MGTETVTELGAAIRRARRAIDVSQVDLAERLDVRQATVSDWEVGRATPSIETVRRIEAALGLPKGQLLVDAGLVDLQAIVASAPDELLAANTDDGPVSPERAAELLEMIRKLLK